MKCFLITMLFFFCSVLAYSQTNLQQQRSGQTKSNTPAQSQTNRSASPAAGISKNEPQNTGSSSAAGVTVISPVPALILWKLPVNLPNPFMKEND
ncbi:MAG: hypothetical protein H7X88_01375 [Gloeobacteraceae cyanobacterium ES-bin-316]|nr:hypothetical protein [Ferruginibacter sp.]